MPSHAETTFVYVDTAIGGPQNRNRVIPADEFQPPSHAVDCYATYIRFTDDILAYMSSNRNPRGRPSVAGYPGPGFATSLNFDFDCESDPSRAIHDGARVIRRIITAHGVPADAPRVFFSGAKGMHLELPASLFGGFAPAPGIAAQLEQAAIVLAGAAPTLDLSIYEKLRLWRAPNTRHSTTGLFKIGITVDELLEGDVETIRTLARRPRCIPEQPDDWDAVPQLVDLWARTIAGSRRSTTSPRTSAGPIAAGARNVTLTSFAGSMQRSGMSVEAIRAALLVENRQRCEPPLDEFEVVRIAASVGRYAPEHRPTPGRLPIERDGGLRFRPVERQARGIRTVEVS